VAAALVPVYEIADTEALRAPPRVSQEEPPAPY